MAEAKTGRLKERVFVVGAVGIPALLAFATIRAYSVPGTNFGTLLMLLPLWALAAFAWIVLSLYGLARWIAERRVPDRTGSVWLTPAAITLAAYLLVSTDLPLRARFELGRGSMEAYAERVVEGREKPRPGRIGLFEAERVERVTDGMRFLVAGAGFIDQCGFAYSREGEPAIVGEDQYEHYEGDWHLWCQSW